MNDSGIFDDGQLSRESSVIRMNDNKQETIPSVPCQKRKKIGGANNKKRRKYEEIHIDHNYVLTPLPHLTPDQQSKYLYGSQAEETNGDGVAEPEQGLEGQISSPGLEGVEGIESKVENLKDGESGDSPMTKREKEEFIRDTEARLRKEGKLPPKELSPAVTEKRSRSSSEEKIERAPKKPPKIRAEPGPSFHSAVLKTMPPPEKRKHDPEMSETARQMKELEMKMKELDKKKEELETKSKVEEYNRRKRLEYERKKAEFEREKRHQQLAEKQERRKLDQDKKKLDDMQARYKEMQRQLQEKEQRLSSGGSSTKRDIHSVESRHFPGERKRRDDGGRVSGRGGGGGGMRIESDSEEYDSEMDDFIDDTDAKVDIGAEIRNIFG